MYLDAHGDCEVRVENEGRRALAAAREFRPDVIFLDIVMPDADGGTIAAEIKADPGLRNIPVVFLTALVSQHVTHGVQAQIGGHPFLAKPVDPDIVLECVQKYTSVHGR
jgi:CheY-like chemotaxis protein